MYEESAKSRGGVIWITGYSAAGKTTVGRKVEFRLRCHGLRSLFLDGDDMRAIFADRWGYTRAERIELAKVYFRLCSHLSAQGFTVVIAAVAMYKEVREWLRQNVSNSIEVYLSVPKKLRQERDLSTKKLYQNNVSMEDLYDEPDKPDLIVENHSKLTSDAAAEIVARYYLTDGLGRRSDKNRKEYWNMYYQSSHAPETPSSFASYVAGLLDIRSEILEVGCGNGRDAAYFHRMGNKVTAIDLSESAINTCQERYSADGMEFLCGTISSLEATFKNGFDVVYSRFCLHAMTSEEEQEFLVSSKRVLKSLGNLFIECRSINDPLARKGEVLSPTERIFGHYRRFIVLEELNKKLTELGFKIILADESNNISVLGDDNPVVIRVIAQAL